MYSFAKVHELENKMKFDSRYSIHSLGDGLVVGARIVITVVAGLVDIGKC